MAMDLRLGRNESQRDCWRFFHLLCRVCRVDSGCNTNRCKGTIHLGALAWLRLAPLGQRNLKALEGFLQPCFPT